MSDIEEDMPHSTGDRNLMATLRDSAFDGKADQLALALGRPNEEVAGWLDGSVAVDEDGLMKARALADERGTETEQD